MNNKLCLLAPTHGCALRPTSLSGSVLSSSLYSEDVEGDCCRDQRPRHDEREALVCMRTCVRGRRHAERDRTREECDEAESHQVDRSDGLAELHCSLLCRGYHRQSGLSLRRADSFNNKNIFLSMNNRGGSSLRCVNRRRRVVERAIAMLNKHVYNEAMAKQYLSKTIWYDPEENGYIGLDITADIPPQTEQSIDGTRLLPKNEYHCSLVAVRRYVDDTEHEQYIANAVRDFLVTHELRFVGLGSERYVCRKEDRMTIIAPVIIESIDEFRNFVQTVIPGYRVPFSHVTLLKSEATEFGIGINSLDELGRYCEKLT